MPRVFYQCQRCTACCRWPGGVHLTPADIAAASAHVGLSEYEFIQRHTRLNHRRSGLVLLDRADGACEWLDGIDCRLQAAKPIQCRRFPNEWNFPGWESVCQAIPVERHDPGACAAG